MLKAVIYARVSSDRQEKEGFSIPAQLELLRNYAVNKNIAVLKEFEDAETAKKAGRTNFNCMLKYLKEHKEVKAILVEKTDRLYRNFKDYVTLEDYDIEIHLVKEGCVLSENSKSHEKFIHGIKVLMAKNYIDNLSEEIRKGQAQKVKEGFAVGRVPKGYKKLDNKQCIIAESEARFVKRAFELYSNGTMSLAKVARQLQREGFIYNVKKPVISSATLEKILKTKFYYGVIEYRGNIYEGKHDPIISKELYDKVQLAFKKDNKPKYYDTNKFLFAGLLKCKRCSCSITAEIKKGKYIYYSCTGGRHECKEEHLYIPEEKIEKQIIEILKRIKITNEEKDFVIQGLKESHKEEQQYLKERVTALNKQKELLKERLNKIYLDKIDGKISENFWLEKHDEWTEELMNVQYKLTALESTSTNYLKHGIKILDLLTNIENVYLNAGVEEKQNLIKNVLQNLTLEGGNVGYYYKTPFNIFVKGVVYNKWWRLGDSNS